MAVQMWWQSRIAPFVRRHGLTAAFAMLLALLAVGPTLAGHHLPTAVNRDNAGHGVKGHDLVAYHEQREAVPGRDDFTVEWDGVTYLFSTAENLRKFSAAPDQYLPAFGGYCAYGVLMGEKVDIDPRQFHFEDGRLMFYFSGGTRSQWLRNREKNFPLSLSAWERIRDLTPTEIAAGHQ